MSYWLMLLILSVSVSQETPLHAPLSADNFQAFRPIIQIDFDSFESQFDSGWFVTNDDGSRIAVVDQHGRVSIIDDAGILIDSYSPFADDRLHPGSMIDAVFLGDRLYAIHRVDDYYTLGTTPFRLEGYYPQSIWANDAGEIFIEGVANDPTTINMIFAVNIELDTISLVPLHPYAPSQDETAVVRIGRIHAPYAVTSSQRGMVTLWNLETGTAIFHVDNGLGQPSVFGAINSGASHLVWRDNLNESLYILDFVRGENRSLDVLDGEYAQWFLLSSDSSLALAVNLGFAPQVVAWDVTTGERTILGNYRDCERPQPDAVHLSSDGSTLVIGCDAGLEIWRVARGE